MSKSEVSPTHYDILALPPPHPSAPSPTETTIKLAYHRALLAHHPDKSLPLSNNARYTIDEITLAYRVLSDASTRASYNRTIATRSANATRSCAGDGPAAELVDLDELAYDEDTEVWYRACRCGQERGFRLREEDLEKAMREGEMEVIAGCGGCSLWIRVMFEWVDER